MRIARMLIKESKLRQIIKSVIRESMGATGMPPGGGMDPKIEAMNLLKNQLMQMSDGQLDLFVDQKVEEHIENDQPYVYGNFEDLGGANVYNVYMFDDEFRIALDVSGDEIDQMCVSADPSQVMADGAASLAAQVMQEWSNNFPGSGGTKTRGGSGTMNSLYDEDDEEPGTFDDDSYDEEWKNLPPPKPVKPRRQKSSWANDNSQIGQDNRWAEEQSYQADLAAYKEELAAWEAWQAKHGK